MKRTLLVPVVVFLYTALFGVLIGVVVALIHSDTTMVVHHLGPIILAATVLAVLFTVIRSIFRAIIPPLFLVLTAISVVAIVAGVLLIDETVISHRLGDPALQSPLPTDVILYGPDYSIRIGDTTGASLQDVLVFRRHSVPTIIAVDEAVWNEQTMEIVALGDTDIRLSAGELIGVEWRRLPASVESIVEDVVSLYTVLRSTVRADLMETFLVFSVGFILAIVGVWTPARLFRWPLLNLLVSIVYLRLILAVPTLVVRFSVASWVPEAVPPFVGANLIPFIWAVLGVVLLTIAVFLPSLERWRREITGTGERS